MNQRYQPVLEELAPEDQSKLADAIVEHIANFLMYKPLEKTEGKNLVRYMILWCSTHKMETKETVKWHGIDIPIADLLCGLSLRCEYMTNGVKQEHDLMVVARKYGEGNEVSL